MFFPFWTQFCTKNSLLFMALPSVMPYMKCRFNTTCELHQSNSGTCQHDYEADGYCGKYEELKSENERDPNLIHLKMLN